MSFFQKRCLRPSGLDMFSYIALEKRYVTEEDLRAAKDLQESESPLGEILIRMGKLTPLQYDEIVAEQERRAATSLEERSRAEVSYQMRLFQRIIYDMRDTAAVASGTASSINLLASK